MLGQRNEDNANKTKALAKFSPYLELQTFLVLGQRNEDNANKTKALAKFSPLKSGVIIDTNSSTEGVLPAELNCSLIN